MTKTASLETYKWEIFGQVTQVLIEDENLLINLENKIKNNYNEDLFYKTNVKGRMTHWDFFVRDEHFKKVLSYYFKCLYREGYWLSFFDKQKDRYNTTVMNAWGNCLTKEDHVIRHHHLGSDYASVLYFDDHAPLCTDAGEFKTKRGMVITIPSYLFHWVNPLNKNITRYTLAWNWSFTKEWDPANGEVLK